MPVVERFAVIREVGVKDDRESPRCWRACRAAVVFDLANSGYDSALRRERKVLMGRRRRSGSTTTSADALL